MNHWGFISDRKETRKALDCIGNSQQQCTWIYHRMAQQPRLLVEHEQALGG